MDGSPATYDPRGNRETWNGLTTTHDSDNRLVRAQASGLDVTYSYDADGRRVSKDFASGGADVSFLHAGDMEIAEYDAAGALLRRYVPGAGVDDRVAMVEADGTRHYYIPDRLGNVIALVDEAGALTDQYLYSPFGVETPLNGSGNPFRYTGRRYDPETGLYFYRARYYDPDWGRFLQTDPVLYADQMNLYAYVGNDPLNFTDPTGRECVSVGETYSCDPPGEDIGEYTLPRPSGAPDYIGERPIHPGGPPAGSGPPHIYTAETHSPEGVGPEVLGAVENAVIDRPTPGGAEQNPATPEGSLNHALGLPPIMGIDPPDNVLSHVVADSNGNVVVVNITIPGAHFLSPGIVSQGIIPTSEGVRIVVVARAMSF